jgi:hypothetical protein
MGFTDSLARPSLELPPHGQGDHRPATMRRRAERAGGRPALADDRRSPPADNIIAIVTFAAPATATVRE